MTKRLLIIGLISGLLLCPTVSFAGTPDSDLPHAGGYRETREYDLWVDGNSDSERYSGNGSVWDDGYWDDEYWDDGWYDDYQEGDYWDDEDWDDEYWDDDYWDDEDGWYEKDRTHRGDQSGELLTWEEGLGSAGELDGRIVVVSIFLSDKKNEWDFSNETNQLRREHSLAYLNIALDWITENAARWGKYPEFIYDLEQYDDLYYEMESDENVANTDIDPTYDMNEMIMDFVDPDSLLEEYDADNILFLAYINSPMSNRTVSFTIPYDDTLGDDTMEICYMFLCSEGEEETPAAYAHEILHTFGAPDLYNADYPPANYNIDEDFVSYCEINHPNEIMLTTYDVNTDEPYYDHISNELTEITAYYIGWTDHSKEAEDFGLQESQHAS